MRELVKKNMIMKSIFLIICSLFCAHLAYAESCSSAKTKEQYKTNECSFETRKCCNNGNWSEWGQECDDDCAEDEILYNGKCCKTTPPAGNICDGTCWVPVYGFRWADSGHRSGQGTKYCPSNPAGAIRAIGNYYSCRGLGATKGEICGEDQSGKYCFQNEFCTEGTNNNQVEWDWISCDKRVIGCKPAWNYEGGGQFWKKTSAGQYGPCSGKTADKCARSSGINFPTACSADVEAGIKCNKEGDSCLKSWMNEDSNGYEAKYEVYTCVNS